MAGGVGGIVCFLLTHEILSSRQYMRAGLKKVRDTERSEHTAIHPAIPSPVPTLPCHDTWNNPSFDDMCSTNETYSCTAKISF